jgi:uncharacterized protein YhjY with autotransporter beta-barrel domain
MIAESNQIQYDQRHGGPWDRGSADSYYHRPYSPHYYVGATSQSVRVELAEMTAEEITAYTAGYNWNERFGNKKDWG